MTPEEYAERRRDFLIRLLWESGRFLNKMPLDRLEAIVTEIRGKVPDTSYHLSEESVAVIEVDTD